MNGNYSEEKNEMFDLVGRTIKILKLAEKLYSEKDFEAFENNAHTNVANFEKAINSDLELAQTITSGGFMYHEGNSVRNISITNALLAKQIESAYGVKTDFMYRDENKQPTLYERFASDYFGKMFGDKGYRQLFEGKGKEFTEDFKKYGATEEEIDRLEKALENSIETGEYNLDDERFATELCTKVSENRKKYEGERVKIAAELWEEAAYMNPEAAVPTKKKTL